MANAVEQAKPDGSPYSTKLAPETTWIKVGRETFVFLRNLLLAPDDDEHATADAIRGLQAYYREYYCPPDEIHWKEDPSDGDGQVIGATVANVFDVVEQVPLTDGQLKRLADLIIGLKREAAQKFDPGNPQLGWAQMMLEEEAYMFWNACRVDFRSTKDKCHTAVNMSALLAKLTGADMLGRQDVFIASNVIKDGLEDSASSKSSPLVSAAAADIAAQFLLFAGKALTEVVDAEKWKTWAAKLRNFADSTAADVEWDFKNNAQKAYGKVVQLRPELF